MLPDQGSPRKWRNRAEGEYSPWSLFIFPSPIILSGADPEIFNGGGGKHFLRRKAAAPGHRHSRVPSLQK